jgi:hypothetical protein
LVGSHLSQVKLEVADGVGLELCPHPLVAVDIGQPADAMTSVAAMQAGACQMRDGRLKAFEYLSSRYQLGYCSFDYGDDQSRLR